ncbi:hypothetical protein [Diaphorobacter caeni]|uniref:hypothetical protein n=1 Tax=Diaphorobacter caeni TaxID=2784387 RepID=UPI0018907E65|nr:hypothetical protein [Diaphorobacter caeni]MBF5007848.1 hypothetical protein [Diaphorobacter caeni]
MKKQYELDGHKYLAADCVDGILIDPVLPVDFDSTPNDDRSPEDLMRWELRPFIKTSGDGEERRYVIRCLDFGAWDRSTNWGYVASLDEAVELVRNTQIRDYRLPPPGMEMIQLGGQPVYVMKKN